jgi:hypothetical protein
MTLPERKGKIGWGPIPRGPRLRRSDAATHRRGQVRPAGARAMLCRYRNSGEASPMLAQRRRAPDQWFRLRWGRHCALPRRIGLIGAAVALAAQVAIGLAPMRQMAGDGAGVLARVAALWGGDTHCLPFGPAQGKPHGQPGPLAGHDCPICQALQQTTAVLAPAAVEIAPVSWVPLGADAPKTSGRPARPAPSQAQPRAPPSTA